MRRARDRHARIRRRTARRRKRRGGEDARLPRQGDDRRRRQVPEVPGRPDVCELPLLQGRRGRILRHVPDVRGQDGCRGRLVQRLCEARLTPGPLANATARRRRVAAPTPTAPRICMR
ncbi:conserved hypothetical protein [Burkholderia cenocepacia]|nr:conserved hypothetical protein [Burkholderia cenocepacia]